MKRLQIPLWKTKALNLGGLGAEPPNTNEGKPKTTEKEKKSMYMLIFPFILIALDIGAAVMCLIGKDYKKCVYWLAAAVLNLCVTL